MELQTPMPDIKLICGHYGCGKTNLAINMAINSSKKGIPVTLVDMDIVNPYFRSSDYADLIRDSGIRLIAPNFGHTNLDIPSLSAEVYSVFEAEGEVIFDVGGDDAGSTVLGRFSSHIKNSGYQMYYVINKYRNLTSSSKQAVEMLREIESACRLKATGIINNSHLKNETVADTILNSMDYAKETANLLCIPLLFTTAPRQLAEDLREIEYLYPIDVYVKTSWENY